MGTAWVHATHVCRGFTIRVYGDAVRVAAACGWLLGRPTPRTPYLATVPGYRRPAMCARPSAAASSSWASRPRRRSESTRSTAVVGERARM
eukprot:351486-Chlamydomonas_euryale.AAC.4